MKSIVWILPMLCVHTHAAESHSHWLSDKIGYREKYRLRQICQEILKDIMLKQRQLENIKREHSMRVSYEVGIVIGKLREKYKRIMDMYRELMDRYRQRNMLFGPGIWDLRPFYFVLAMETIKGLEIEIDNSIQILENIPPELINQEHTFGNVKNKGLLRPLDLEAHPGVPAFIDISGPSGLRIGRELATNISTTTEKAVTIKSSTVKLIVDYQGSPVPEFKSQAELKKYLRERYEPPEGPKEKAMLLDHLYGIV